jgi:ATP-dependent DNA helicase DinG
LLESDESLLWIAKDNQKLSFKVTPKNLNNIKLPFVRGTLLTSGTLAEKGKTCLPFAERLNLTLQTDKVLPTPFSLKDRTLVYASRTVSPKSSDYENQLEQEIFELITKGEMKTFVLFTSNDTMGKMHANLKYFIEQHAMSLGEKVEVWLQDKSNYEEVMNSFKNPDVRTVLFGTYTYFEGIDLKNESLTQVILTRLPFSVPDHPIQQLLDRNSNFSEWEANIRFEQAFGRLIRTTNDYGTFAILDSRIYFNHNKSFLELFKNENVTVTDDINDIEAFYKNIKK